MIHLSLVAKVRTLHWLTTFFCLLLMSPLFLHMTEMSAAGFSLIGPFSPTYFLFGKYSTPGGSLLQRQSTNDHVWGAGLNSPSVTMEDFASTDHRLVKISIPVMLGPERTVTFKKRNLKHLSSASLCSALDINRLAGSLLLDDVDPVHDIITGTLVDALDVVAPMMRFTTRQRPIPLYLQKDTMEVMAARDRAAKSGDASYRWLRNQATHLVRRDSHQSARNFITGLWLPLATQQPSYGN